MPRIVGVAVAVAVANVGGGGGGGGGGGSIVVGGGSSGGGGCAESRKMKSHFRSTCSGAPSTSGSTISSRILPPRGGAV